MTSGPIRRDVTPGAARVPDRPQTPGRRAALFVVLGALALSLIAALTSCVPPTLLTLRGGLDSLRLVVDTLVVRDSIAYRVLSDTRREVAEQRDIILSTRASTGTTTRELFDEMTALQGKLDEVLGRFQQFERRAPSGGGASDPMPLYEQASQDLTQGRYALALRGFREFLQRAPGSSVADNAQYGVGECFFAQSLFDSAATEYARVPKMFPDGDRVPASLYKLALSQEKLGRGAESHKTMEDLIRRFPLSGEAQLARERLGRSKH